MSNPDPKDILSPEELAAVRHWADYGQKGVTPQCRVMSWDWDTQDFLSPRSAPWSLSLQPHQLPILLLGFCPGKSQSTVLETDDVLVGDRMMTHGFVSTTKNPKMKASEDKWFVYAVGPDAGGSVHIHMHRSWSGEKVIELAIECGPAPDTESNQIQPPAKIVSITWDHDVMAVTHADRAKEIAREVCRWILAVDIDEKYTGPLRRNSFSTPAYQDVSILALLSRTFTD